MKIVLLPGMDGTGNLFEDVIAELSSMDVVAVSLPSKGSQSYEELSSGLVSILPNEEFIIVAESFSGGIAACLSKRNIPNLKAVVFVASFLSAPKKIVAYMASILPIQQFTKLPLFKYVCRFLFLGKEATGPEIERFKRTVLSVPSSILRSRLKVIATSKYSGFKSSLPAVYIGASDDMLVSASKRKEFKEAYQQIAFVELEGPHFLLQANPKKGAAAIIEAVRLLTSQGSRTASPPAA